MGFRLTNQAVLPPEYSYSQRQCRTLNDFQKLLGDINWLHPYLKLTTGELKPLFDIHKGSSDPTSPRSLTSERLVEKSASGKIYWRAICHLYGLLLVVASVNFQYDSCAYGTAMAEVPYNVDTFEDLS